MSLCWGFFASEVRDGGVLSLVSKLTSLLLMIEVGREQSPAASYKVTTYFFPPVQVLSGTGDSLELNSLTQAIEEIGSNIRPENGK